MNKFRPELSPFLYIPRLYTLASTWVTSVLSQLWNRSCAYKKYEQADRQADRQTDGRTDRRKHFFAEKREMLNIGVYIP